MAERLFYCGRPPPPRDAGRAIYLRLREAAPNINLRIEDIEKRMVAQAQITCATFWILQPTCSWRIE